MRSEFQKLANEQKQEHQLFRAVVGASCDEGTDPCSAFRYLVAAACTTSVGKSVISVVLKKSHIKCLLAANV